MLETNRLRLRQWVDSDIPTYIEINRDPEVMAYFPQLHDERTTRDIVERCQQHIAQHGWGFWAVEIRDTAEFIGSVGLRTVPFTLPGTAEDEQRMEIGWRLAKHSWGNGYAVEAARASLDHAFRRLGQSRVCAFTVVANRRSRRVMEKLQMTDTGLQFHHPDVPPESGLAEHVLYEISSSDYFQNLDWI